MMLHRIKGKIIMCPGHQNKYDSLLKIQFRNNVEMGKDGRN